MTLIVDHVKKYRVSEVFGPTIQGEGALIGMPCLFIRFAGCDYRCSWCDSLHAVLPEYVARTPQFEVYEITDKVIELAGGTPGVPAVKWVVLSGGNPALHDLTALVEDLRHMGFSVMIETQGSIWQPWFEMCDSVCFSPKPPSSGYQTDIDQFNTLLTPLQVTTNPQVIARRYYLKVVVFDEADYEYAKAIRKRFPDWRLFLSVGNPNPPNPSELDDPSIDLPGLCRRLKWLMEKVANDPEMPLVRVLPQMHVFAWGNERAR
jgi:7-carboxy-7-deazaguanine synthase